MTIIQAETETITALALAEHGFNVSVDEPDDYDGHTPLTLVYTASTPIRTFANRIASEVTVTLSTHAPDKHTALKEARAIAAAFERIAGFTSDGCIIRHPRITTDPESDGLHPVNNASYATTTATFILQDI